MGFLAPIAPALIGGAATLGGAMLANRRGRGFQELPSPPQMEETMDVIDKIAGVQSIVRTGSNGKKERVIERLPRSREDEALYNEAGNIMSNALRNIQNLHAVDPNAALNYAPFINTINALNEQRGHDMARLVNVPNFAQFAQDFKNSEQASIREQYREMRNARQNELVGLGYGIDSTAWANSSAAIDAEEAKALRGIDVRAQMAGQEYGKGELQNRLLAYGLGEEARGAQRQSAIDELNARQQQLAERELRRQHSIAEQGNLYALAAGTRGQDQNMAMHSLAPHLQSEQYRNALMAYQAGNQAIMHNQLNRTPNFGETVGQLMGNIGGQLISNNIDSLTAPRRNNGGFLSRYRY